MRAVTKTTAAFPPAAFPPAAPSIQMKSPFARSKVFSAVIAIACLFLNASSNGQGIGIGIRIGIRFADAFSPSLLRSHRSVIIQPMLPLSSSSSSSVILFAAPNSQRRVARRDLKKRTNRRRRDANSRIIDPQSGEAASATTNYSSSSAASPSSFASAVSTSASASAPSSVETRPMVRSKSVEAGEDYWIDESDLKKSLERERAIKNRKAMEGEISIEKLKTEVVAPYKQNWIGLFSVFIVVLATIVTQFPELLQSPIIPIPDL